MRHILQYLHTLVICLALMALALPVQAEKNSPDASFESRDFGDYASAGIPSGLISGGKDNSYFSPYVFVVDKTDRVLSLWKYNKDHFQKIKVYPADIGKNSGNKTSRGDYATPEGVYFMMTQMEGPSLNYELYGSRAFTLDYPNFFDRKQNKTGNGIWLHAVPDSVSLKRGSRGCVVVRNEVIKTLHPYFTPRMTPIIIQDKIEFLPEEEFAKRREQVFATVEKWRQAWQSKDIESYISFYHTDFRAQGKNREQWRNYKQSLNDLYTNINVILSEPVAYIHDDELTVRFIQFYQSDMKQDVGEKVLYLKKSGQDFKIIGEDWRPETGVTALAELQKSANYSSYCKEHPDVCEKGVIKTSKTSPSASLDSTIQ